MTSARGVTRGDIERKLDEIREAERAQADKARSKAVPVIIAGVVLTILLAYLLGRRRGRKKTTIVEIRRV
jgi:hypothetical protein